MAVAFKLVFRESNLVSFVLNVRKRLVKGGLYEILIQHLLQNVLVQLNDRLRIIQE